MKKDTEKRHKKIANDIKHYIYKHIDTDISLDELSENLNISKYHMLRIFKNEFELNIYESIKAIRLQKASNLLLTNKKSTITNVAKMCGYSSHGAFNRAFKKFYNMTPKEWRSGGYKRLVKLNNDIENFNNEPQIVKMGSNNVYYIRHKGYDDSIKAVWQKLYTWTLINELEDFYPIGYYHDIPTINSINNLKYTAGIMTKKDIGNSNFPSFKMPKIVYAKFEYQGRYEDFFSFINWVHFIWLINSGYETTAEPSFAIYKTCDFLKNKDDFTAEYYISISI